MMPRPPASKRSVRLLAGVAAFAVAGSGAAYAGLADPAGANRHSGDQTAEVASEIRYGKAKNVILFIGDGMGDSEITVARDYLKGAAGELEGIDALPLTGQYTTYSLHKPGTIQQGVDVGGKPDYDPESASTASAWSTGVKAYDGSLSVNLQNQPQQTLLELARAKGLKTGDVTTSEIQDATPAAQYAHIPTRGCYTQANVDATASCAGFKSITEQLIAARPDVVLGGGRSYFDEVVGGKSWWDKAADAGYQRVENKAGLDALQPGTPALGLFHAKNLETQFASANATKDGNKAAPVTCQPNPARPATQPTLADMTDKAIELLDNDKGFFLQVEGASIDKRDHAADACGQIGETDDLDKAVKVALDYAEQHGDTSIFVTADHAHTSQIIEVGSTSPGVSINLINPAADNVPLAVNYGTTAVSDPTDPSAVNAASQQHTGSQLRIAGYGPGAANVVGLTDNTDLFNTISRVLGLKGETLDPEPPVKTVTKTVTVVKQVVPARVKANVNAKIKQLTRQVRKAKGDRKVKLKAQLAAYKAIRRQLG
jgi:alkaline phosphatase